MRPEPQVGIAPLRRGLPPPRRRVRRARWLRLGWRVIAAASLLSAAAWLAGSQRFSVQHLVVNGARRVDPSWVAARLQPLIGRPLLPLRWPEVLTPLAEQPWIAGLSIHKVLPDTLEVRLEEHQPVALLRQGAELVYLSADGWPIAPYRAGNGDDLSLLSYRRPLPVPVDQATAMIVELRTAAPQWADELSELEILGEGDVRVITDALPCPVLLRRGSVRAGVERLRQLWPALSEHLPGLGALDLRFEDRIIVQPGDLSTKHRLTGVHDIGEAERGLG